MGGGGCAVIYFIADGHFGKRPGHMIYQRLRGCCNMSFHENDWTALESPDFAQRCSLLVLNMIGETCDQPHPGPAAERGVREYVDKGGEILLLHGSSAAFWRWDWWRALPGLRWVRENDPDGFPASHHPVRPYSITRSKCRHPLTAMLQEMDLETDEIYVELEQTAPITVFLQTRIEEGTYPQCFQTVSPQGGRIVSFLPGHNETTFDNPQFMENIRILLTYMGA